MTINPYESPQAPQVPQVVHSDRFSLLRVVLALGIILAVSAVLAIIDLVAIRILKREAEQGGEK